MIRRAAKVFRDSRNPRRLGLCAPDPRSNTRPYRCIGVSMYVDVLERIDDTVSALKELGHTGMSRSELLRIAFQQFDICDVGPP